MKFPFDRVNAIAYIVFLIVAVILSLPLFVLIMIKETIGELKFKWSQSK